MLSQLAHKGGLLGEIGQLAPAPVALDSRKQGEYAWEVSYATKMRRQFLTLINYVNVRRWHVVKNAEKFYSISCCGFGFLPIVKPQKGHL